MTASLVNAASVGLFALSMLTGSLFLSYLSSMFIAFSFVPMLGVFSPAGDLLIGTILLLIWCAYFIPVGILSYGFFKRAA